MNKSHLTAMRRKVLSAPMAYLVYDLEVIPSGAYGNVCLDYGCGRGDDAYYLNFNMYDPYYFPNTQVLNARYLLITCNYVLNVVEDNVGKGILRHIQSLLLSDGVAYIGVRRDIKVEGYTTKGTYQRNVVLDLPVVYEKKGNFCIYRIDKNTTL